MTVLTAPDGERHAPLQLGVRRRPVLLLVVIIARLHTTTQISRGGRGAGNEILRNLPNIWRRPEISLAALVVSSHAGHRKAGTCLVVSRGVTLR